MAEISTTRPLTDEDWMYWQKLAGDEHDRHAAEIVRLREALTEYACPGRGACPSPWTERGCSLGDNCGLLAADALAGVQNV